MNHNKSKQGISVLIIIICIAILAAVGGFAAYKMRKNSVTSMTPEPTAATAMTGTTGTPQVTPTQAAMTAAPGNSDTDLQQDSIDVSTKLNALSTDATSIDQGLNDQQGNLSEN